MIVDKNFMNASSKKFMQLMELNKNSRVMTGEAIYVRFNRKDVEVYVTVLLSMWNVVEHDDIKRGADILNDPELTVFMKLLVKFYDGQKILDSNCNNVRNNWIDIQFTKTEIEEFQYFFTDLLGKFERYIVLAGEEIESVYEIYPVKILNELLEHLTRKNS